MTTTTKKKPLAGSKTYLGIASMVAGFALKSWGAPSGIDVTPEVVAELANLIMAGGAVLATVGRKLAQPKVVDQQDRDTPKP